MQALFQKARAWRCQVQLPPPIDRMLTFQQLQIHNPQHLEKPKKARGKDWSQYRSLGQTDQFMESFASLPLDEKFQEYCRVIGLVQKLLRGEPLMPVEFMGQRYRFDAYIKDGIIRKSWQKCRIELQMASSIAQTVGRDASSVDLHFYLMRRSKNKHRYAFALESIRYTVPRIVRIGFDTLEEVEKCFDAFRMAMDKAHGENYQKEFRPYFQRQQMVEQQRRQQERQMAKVTSPRTPEYGGTGETVPSFNNPEQFIRATVESPKLKSHAQPPQPPQLQLQQQQTPSAHPQPQPKPQPQSSTPQPPTHLQKRLSQHTPQSAPTNLPLTPSVLHQRTNRTSQGGSIIDGLSITRSNIGRPSNPSEPFYANISNIREAGSITHPSSTNLRYSSQISSSVVGNNGGTTTTSKLSLLHDSQTSDSQQLSLHCKNLFNTLLQNLNLQQLSNSSNYKVIKTAPTYQLLQHPTSTSKFKLILNLSSPRNIVLDGIVDPSNYPLWNPQVQTAVTKTRVFENNTLVCYQKHKQISQYEKSREFLYARHLFKKDNKIYMLDQSIESSLFRSSFEFMRGELTCVWMIQELLNGRMAQLILEIDVKQNGTMQAQVEFEGNVRYLEGLAQLDYYLVKQKSFVTKASDYFDLEWALGRRGGMEYNVVVNSPDVLVARQERDKARAAPKRVKEDIQTSAFNLRTSGTGDGKYLSNPMTTKFQQNQYVAPTGDDLFDQELSVINEQDFVTAVGKQDYEDLQNRSIPHLSFQSMGSEDQPAYPIPVASPTNKLRSSKPQHAPKVVRKFTDQLGNELQDQLRTHGSYTKQTDSRQFSQQLQNLLAGRDPHPSALKPTNPTNPTNPSTLVPHPKKHPQRVASSGDDQLQFQLQKQPSPHNHNHNHSLSKQQYEIDSKQLNKASLQSFDTGNYKLDLNTGCVIPSPEYLYCRSTMWPINSDYRAMTGGNNWRNFLQGNTWRANPKGQLICLQSQKLRQAHNTYKNLTKLLGDRYITPKLPVTVLTSTSTLQHLAKSLCFMPYYLQQASKQPNILTRFKLLTAECLVTSLLQVELLTPFAAMTGETFQGWVYGCPVYLEQIRTNITALLMIGRGYRVTGLLQIRTDLGSKQRVTIKSGEIRVVFDSYEMGVVGVRLADCLVKGLGSTDEQVKWTLFNKAFVYDSRNLLFSQLLFNPNHHHRRDTFTGGIYRITSAVLKQLLKNPQGLSPNSFELTEQLAQIQGNWCENMLINGEEYFNIKRDKPCSLDYESHPLESDSTFREDVVYKRRGDLARAQIEKERLEEEEKRRGRRGRRMNRQF